MEAELLLLLCRHLVVLFCSERRRRGSFGRNEGVPFAHGGVLVHRL